MVTLCKAARKHLVTCEWGLGGRADVSACILQEWHSAASCPGPIRKTEGPQSEQREYRPGNQWGKRRQRIGDQQLRDQQQQMPQPTWAAETWGGSKAAGPRLGSPLPAGPPVPDPGKLEPRRTSQEGRPWCCSRGKATCWLLPHLSPTALSPGDFSLLFGRPGRQGL